MHVGNTDRFVRYFPTLAFTLFFFLQKGVEACAGISPFQTDGLVKQWLYDYTRSSFGSSCTNELLYLFVWTRRIRCSQITVSHFVCWYDQPASEPRVKYYVNNVVEIIHG